MRYLLALILLTGCRPLPSPALLLEQEARAYFEAARAVRHSGSLHDREHAIVCELAAADVVDKAHSGYPNVSPEADKAKAEMLRDCGEAKIKPVVVDMGSSSGAAYPTDGGSHDGR